MTRLKSQYSSGVKPIPAPHQILKNFSVENEPKQKIYWQEMFPNDFEFKDEVLKKEYDAVVIGGGIVGLSVAKTLLDNDLRVALVDQKKIGGNSALSGGIVSLDNEKDLIQWIKELGKENAVKLLNITRAGAKEFLNFIEKNNIEKPEHNGVLVVARTPYDSKLLNDELNARNEIGMGLEYLSRDKLDQVIKSNVFSAGYVDRNTSTINPYNTMRRFADFLRSHGCDINEQTKVLSVDKTKVSINTHAGAIKAKNIFITSGPLADRLVRLNKHHLPLTTFLVVTKPLKPEEVERVGWRNREAIWDIGIIFSYFRILQDRRIMYGPGNADCFGDFTKDHQLHERIARNAESDLKKIFSIPAKVEYIWSGNIHVTEDELPDFGSVCSGVFYGVGASLALGFWIGKQLAQMSLGQVSEEFSTFSTIQKHRSGPHSLLFHAPLPRRLKIFLANRLIRFLD